MAQDGLTIGGSAYVCKKKTIVRGIVEMALAYVISVIRQVNGACIRPIWIGAFRLIARQRALARSLKIGVLLSRVRVIDHNSRVNDSAHVCFPLTYTDVQNQERHCWWMDEPVKGAVRSLSTIA
jgi:hypothetical protein